MYAIKDKDTDLYVATKPCRLAQIERAKLFDSKEEAKLMLGNIINQLVWRHLEKTYNKDRWSIDVDFIEFSNVTKIYSRMEVIEVNINESSQK